MLCIKRKKNEKQEGFDFHYVTLFMTAVSHTVASSDVSYKLVKATAVQYQGSCNDMNVVTCFSWIDFKVIILKNLSFLLKNNNK